LSDIEPERDPLSLLWWRKYLAIPLFFYTGLRLGECLGLMFSDCCRDDHTIYVHQSLLVKEDRLPDGTWATRKYEVKEHLKGNADPRTIIVSDQGFDIIDKIRDIHKKNSRITDLLFPGVSESNVQLKLKRACRTLGLKERSPHKWRKTYISALINDGADMDFVRKQVGHKDIQTTLNSYTYSTKSKDQQLEQLTRTLSVQTG